MSSKAWSWFQSFARRWSTRTWRSDRTGRTGRTRDTRGTTDPQIRDSWHDDIMYTVYIYIYILYSCHIWIFFSHIDKNTVDDSQVPWVVKIYSEQIQSRSIKHIQMSHTAILLQAFLVWFGNFSWRVLSHRESSGVVPETGRCHQFLPPEFLHLKDTCQSAPQVEHRWTWNKMEHDGICHPMLARFKDADGASSSWKMEPGCEAFIQTCWLKTKRGEDC